MRTVLLYFLWNSQLCTSFTLIEVTLAEKFLTNIIKSNIRKPESTCKSHIFIFLERLVADQDRHKLFSCSFSRSKRVMQKKGHTGSFQIIWYLEQNLTSRCLTKMFQGLKWGIVQFYSTNNFSDTAKIELVYFTIISDNFVVSYKNWKIKKFSFQALLGSVLLNFILCSYTYLLCNLAFIRRWPF